MDSRRSTGTRLDTAIGWIVEGPQRLHHPKPPAELRVVGEFRLQEVGTDRRAVRLSPGHQTGEDFDGRQRQTDPAVVDVVGPFGEQLEGNPDVKVFGSLTDDPSNWLEVETTIPLESPLLAEIQRRQSRPVNSEPLAGFCAA